MVTPIIVHHRRNEQGRGTRRLRDKHGRGWERKTTIKVKRPGSVLVLIWITATMAHSQDTAGDYVAPSEAVPRGKAPSMQVQLLNPGEPTKQYAVIFYQGDEAFSGLLEFAEKYHVTSAHFTRSGR